MPQGSLLGPLLLILFINDLPDVVKPGVKAALYADDTKIYSAVQLVPDCVAVQESLFNMDDWMQYNNIQFNTTKCKVLTVTHKSLWFMIILLTMLSLSVSPKKRIWESLLITHSHGKSMLFLLPQKLINCLDF